MGKYNLNNLIGGLLSNLNNRQKDILRGRYGLADGRSLTLAALGAKYGITRERVRQIESLALALVKARFGRGDGGEFVKLIKNQLNKSGGVRQADLLYQDLRPLFADGNAKNYQWRINFLLGSAGVFKFHPDDSDFYAFWYLNDGAVNKAVASINKLTAALAANPSLSRSGFAENYISLSKKFAVSPYNDFGLACWPHICPKVSRDWSYLVLKKEGQPLHFTALTQAINKLRLNKKTNPQTVHNELIKDNRFVLVGRGTYGLKEFNILPGTAREVIGHILKKHGPQTSKETVRLVLEQRSFKENTLLLNLQDRKRFKRLADGRYTVKEV